MIRVLIPLFLLTTSCQSQTQISPPPQNIADLWAAVDNSDVKICALDMTQIEDGDTTLILENLGPDFTNVESVPYSGINDGPSAMQNYSRRNALRRRLLAGSEGHQHASQYYETLKIKSKPASTLSEHTNRMAHWWERVREQQDRKDTESAKYNIRFCVINEGRGHDAQTARTFILEALDGTPSLPIEDINLYFQQDRIPPSSFKADVMSTLIESGALSPLDKALMRDNQTPIFPSDPKTADTFWLERDKEIDAILTRIETHAYKTLADQFEDMTRIDQTLRGLWHWTQQNRDMPHFTTPEERMLFQEGISERIIRVDAFNTQTLKDMLEGRNWFNDEIDGKGAAHDGWLIAQHADQDPKFQEHVLSLMEASLDDPGVSKSNFAYLTDRVLVKKTSVEPYDASKIVQRYGTQGRCTDDGWKPFTVEDPESINALRASVGLGTLEDYIGHFTCR